jgi:hypothetical protein
VVQDKILALEKKNKHLPDILSAQFSRREVALSIGPSKLSKNIDLAKWKFDLGVLFLKHKYYAIYLGGASLVYE